MHVMLTVDLNKNVTVDQRKKFNEYLEGEDWKKLKLTTTWHASFKDGATEEGMIEVTKKDVKNAASHAGITNYEAAAEIGKRAPTVWKKSS